VERSSREVRESVPYDNHRVTVKLMVVGVILTVLLTGAFCAIYFKAKPKSVTNPQFYNDEEDLHSDEENPMLYQQEDAEQEYFPDMHTLNLQEARKRDRSPPRNY
jgi:hypothetical protein